LLKGNFWGGNLRNLKQSSYGVGRRELHKEPPSLGFMDFPKGPCSPIECYAKNRKSIFQNRNLLGGIKKVELPTEPPKHNSFIPNLTLRANQSVRKIMAKMEKVFSKIGGLAVGSSSALIQSAEEQNGWTA